MSTLFDLSYIQHFQTLPNTLYTPVKPQGIQNPKLILTSESCAQLLGLSPQSLNTSESLQLISGQGILSNWNPIAMKYTGHQFGHYNPELGDGRGVLLAQVNTSNNGIWDLHLKGAGTTPYSRQGDGRAVLRSSIREFLCSEAMAALSIPTSRALCITDSTSTVYRETAETASMVIRVSQSHIRFGHFEFCSFTKQHDLLKELCDFVIDQHYPAISNKINKYAEFYKITVDKTAKLMAHWQSIGFNHGVMNTDNMSIIGDTFDYGPFAFLDEYDPQFICNHSDHQGRYAFNQQPNIANWNLAVLAQALLPMVDKADLVKQLDLFPTIFSNYYLNMMSSKLGLSNQTDKTSHPHKNIIDKTINMLTKCRLDYSYFFRKLSLINQSEIKTALRNMALDIQEFDTWFEQYSQAVIEDGQALNDPQRSIKMNLINPKFILRNYLAQNAISAAKNGDYSVLKTLHQVLQNPFDEQPEHEALAALPPQWSKMLEISCSS